jgi:HAE1 family hydrophobic/amphiphilic exporter-1
MKPLRFRTLIISAVCVCLSTAGALAVQQDEPPTVKATVGQADLRPAPPVSKDVSDRGAYSPLNLNRVGVQTAQPLPISLNDAIRRALENNNDIEVSRDDVRFQETQVRAAKGIYDPVFRVNPNFQRNSNTGSQATNDFRVNSDVTGFVEPGGGNYQFFFNNTRTENAFAQAQVTSGSVTGAGTSAIFASGLGLTYTQPLARNFNIDSRRRSIFIARKRLEQTDSDFRLQANTTIAATQRAYWDYVFALRNQQNEVANVNLAKENLRQVEAKIDAGAAAPLERAEVATELANREGSLLLATQQVGIAENALKQLMLRDPLSSEWSNTFVPTDRPSITLDTVSLDEAMKDAVDNRFELKRLKLDKEINAEDVRFFKNQAKPQIDFNGTFSLEGLSRGSGTTSDTIVPLIPLDPAAINTNASAYLLSQIRFFHGNLPGDADIPRVTIPGTPPFLLGGFNQSLANMFRSDAPNFSVGVTISFPFRNRTAKANLDSALVQEHQLDTRMRAQEQAIIVEVRNAVQAVETSRQRVFTARRARENAEIQLEGERKLYEAGSSRSSTFLLFQRENTLTNARNAEIRAETDYNKALADLQRVTSTAFRANNIQVDSPLPK